MEDTEVEGLLGRHMPSTGHKRLPQRPISGPVRKDFVDGRLVDRRFPMGGCRPRQARPLPPRGEEPQDQVTDAMIAQCALRSPLGGAAGKAANLVGCESPRRQLPDSDG